MSNESLKTNFYCPLHVQMYERESDDYIVVDSSILNDHEEQIRESLAEETHRGGDKDMSEYFYGSHDLHEKLVSVRWDIENVQDTIYGCIRVDLAEPLTDDEIDELREWIRGQNSDGFGEGYEQQTQRTSDGDLNISFWDCNDEYFLLNDEEFESAFGISMEGYQ